MGISKDLTMAGAAGHCAEARCVFFDYRGFRGTNLKRLTPAMLLDGGAVPLTVSGEVIGAIGASGAAARVIGEEDESAPEPAQESLSLNCNYISNPDGINLRPDFMMLVYPVISMDPKIAHMGSRLALLGPKPTDDQVRLFSNELQVTEKAPPTFLMQAADDHKQQSTTLVTKEIF